MNSQELLLLLARFTVTGFGGLVELRCKNCPAVKTFGDGCEDIELTEVFAWARDHRCPGAGFPSLRRAGELTAV